MSASSKKLEYYKKAGQVVSKVLEKTALSLHAGMFILDIAEMTERDIAYLGGVPAFPSNISVNSEVAYNTPPADDTAHVENGDLLKIDIGAHVGGYIVDRATTCEIGTSNHSKMISAAQKALNEGILPIRDGLATSIITEKIENSIKSTGFTPICSCRGHTLEKYALHGKVSIPICFDEKEEDFILQAGDIAAIEVFLTNGTGKIITTTAEIYSVKMEFDVRDLDFESRNLRSYLFSHYGQLPFALRWLPGEHAENVGSIDELLRRGALIQYPASIESSGGMVVHFEQTIVVTKDGHIAL
ncbi:MAG TPA: M24 family metallopeptidase [Candidatus Acidoferrales bacterium]|nr:M24 family metallopeptidase [Candidatus Acidoferrales bacterium]